MVLFVEAKRTDTVVPKQGLEHAPKTPSAHKVSHSHNPIKSGANAPPPWAIGNRPIAICLRHIVCPTAKPSKIPSANAPTRRQSRRNMCRATRGNTSEQSSEISISAQSRPFPTISRHALSEKAKNPPQIPSFSCNRQKCPQIHDSFVKIRRSRLTNHTFCAKIESLHKTNALYGESSPETRFTESRRSLQDGIRFER